MELISFQSREQAFCGDLMAIREIRGIHLPDNTSPSSRRGPGTGMTALGHSLP
jgi:chemotaxis signal transduction protein